MPGLPRGILTTYHTQVTILLTMLIGASSSLYCWYCIGEGCEGDPSLVESATSRPCLPGESCQKVYYMGQYRGTTYESTTRSCSAGPCIDRNDFENCTRELKENPGCMQRSCCNQGNNCNGSTTMDYISLLGIIVLISMHFVILTL